MTLKWPNDLLYKEQKLAGILIEMQGDTSGDVSVVIGVGLNVKMNAASAPSPRNRSALGGLAEYY